MGERKEKVVDKINRIKDKKEKDVGFYDYHFNCLVIYLHCGIFKKLISSSSELLSNNSLFGGQL